MGVRVRGGASDATSHLAFKNNFKQLGGIMKRLSSIALVLMLVCLLAAPAFAGNGLDVNGPHYNLNIIGSKSAKNVNMNNSNRHTIFVALGSTGQAVSTKIYLTRGEFKVCDGNGFDAARDCSGQVIASGNNGAVFQLPCNTALEEQAGITIYPCTDGASAAYQVWARALGSPKNNPSVSISTCATETGDADLDGIYNETYCSTESALLIRQKGTKPTFTNVTNELTSLCVDGPDAGTACDARYALFRDEFTDWFWEYANSGVKLAQLRFYLVY